MTDSRYSGRFFKEDSRSLFGYDTQDKLYIGYVVKYRAYEHLGSGFGKAVENLKTSVAEDTVIKEGKVFRQAPNVAELEELAQM